MNNMLGAIINGENNVTSDTGMIYKVFCELF